MSLILAASKAGILDRAAEIGADISAQATQQIRSDEMRWRAAMCRRMDEVRQRRMARQHGRGRW